MGEHDELMELGKLKEHEAEMVKAALEVAKESIAEVLEYDFKQGVTPQMESDVVKLGIAIFEHWNTGR